MPVAVAIGADPATILSAVLPLPETVSELRFSGLLRGERPRPGARRSACRSWCRPTPRSCIEGWCPPTETAPEGPYGDHTGYYNSVEPFPVMRITAITMRREPIYLSTFTGRPPDEPSVIGAALNDAVPAARAPAVPRNRRCLAAAGGLLLPHGGRVDRQALSRPGPARDDGAVGHAAAVHLHQADHRRGRRHRSRATGTTSMWAFATRFDPVARPRHDRPTRRSTISTSPRRNRGSAASSASTPPTRSARRPSGNGA